MARKKARSIDELPEEILLLILSRLPVSSLMQFKCVSKTWRTLISNPRHFRLNQIDSDPGMIFYNMGPLGDRLYWLNLPAFHRTPLLGKRIPIPPIFSCFRLEASCNGFLLLRDYFRDNSLYIYNPFTGDHVELPKSGDKISTIPIFAMGFNPETEKVTILKITPVKSYSRDETATESEFKIFTIGSDSWRCLGIFPYVFHRNQFSPFLNGNLHWCSNGLTIVSFNLETEEFKEISYPNIFNVINQHLAIFRCEVFVFQGCLSLIAASVAAEGIEDLRLWVMDEYGVAESWRNIFRCEFGGRLNQRIRQNLRPVCIMKDGKLLLQCCVESILVVYDPKCRILEGIRVHVDDEEEEEEEEEEPLNWNGHGAVVHVASLASMGGG